MSKQYGLVLPKKSKDHPVLPVSKSHSIFNGDSDSDSPEVSKPTGIHAIKKQDTLNQKKAVEEDPTVYQYDEIYEEMEQQRKESKLAKKDQEKKPKYINRLLAAAEKRKRENERRIERQVQKEREEEGDKYKDKESFITSAYKKKLEEMRKLEEEEKREEYLESIGDVRKQGNLDGFYRHLYDQKVNYEEIKESDIKKEIKEEAEALSDHEDKTANLCTGDHDSNTSAMSHEVKKETIFSHSECSEDQTKKRKLTNDEKSNKKKVRNYRVRKDSGEQSDETEGIKMEHLPSNIDADSDFSIDSSDSEEESLPKNEQEKMSDQQPVAVENKNPLEEKKEEMKGDIKNEVTEKEKPVEIMKPKIDIWKKRTVGEKFDEAVKRYFERKAQREIGL